ncbi:TPA: hypothetical protein ACGIZD_000344 [Staphylococcus argenteus]
MSAFINVQIGGEGDGVSAFINVQIGGEGDGVSAFINVRVGGAPPARLTRIEKS